MRFQLIESSRQELLLFSQTSKRTQKVDPPILVLLWCTDLFKLDLLVGSPRGLGSWSFNS